MVADVTSRAGVRSYQEHKEAGRGARKACPRAHLAELETVDRAPLAIIEQQNQSRVLDLVPLRMQRMAVSAFTFYRGTAAIMAADLARTPHSGLLVPSCGDAHVSNFGFHASAERHLMFDITDFDEAAWAPWEWDVKRLVTSVVMAGQDGGRSDAVVDGAARAGVRAYTQAMHQAARTDPLGRFRKNFTVGTGVMSLDKKSRAVLRASAKSASKRTGARAARKVSRIVDGRRRFVEDPPILVRLEGDQAETLRHTVERYLETTTVDVRLLLQSYSIADVARRVVGVGSVGTRCSLVLFEDGDGNTLLLQGKEADRSVLMDYGGIAQPDVFVAGVDRQGEGARVVGMQRVLQAIPDPFLGHLRHDGHDLYVRQFHDMKGSITLEALDDSGFRSYAEACAIVLARAHAQAPNAPAVAGYIGHGGRVVDSIVTWAHAYAALAQQDYQRFLNREKRDAVEPTSS